MKVPIKIPATVPTGPPKLPASASDPIAVAALEAVNTNPEVANPKVPEIPNWTANLLYSVVFESIKFWMLFSMFKEFVFNFDRKELKFWEWIPVSCNILFKFENNSWFDNCKFWKNCSDDFFKDNNIEV